MGDMSLAKAVIDDRMAEASKADIQRLGELLELAKQYRVEKLDFGVLDEALLFTPNELKESFFLVTDAMYGEIYGFRKEFEDYDPKESVIDMLCKQTERHEYMRGIREQMEVKKMEESQ